MAETKPGSRNRALYEGVCYVGKWIAHGYLKEDAVLAAFWDACSKNGLTKDDGAAAFKRTFISGLKASENDPPPTLKERPKPGGDGQREGQREPGPSHVNGVSYEPGPNGAEPGSSAGPEAKAKTEADAFLPIQLGNLLRNPAPPRRWLVQDQIPEKQVTLLTGDGGIGKSTLVLQLAAAVATRAPWLGMDVKQGRVAILSAEDDIDEMHWRFQCIARGIEGEHEAKLQALNNVFLIDASKDLDPTLANFDEKAKRLTFTDTIQKLKAFVDANAIDVLILDSAADVFTEEINRYAVRSFIRIIRGLADTVILLGHPSVSGMQSGRGYSGSTHWNNAVRSRLYFTRAMSADGNEPDSDLRFLEVAKSNRSKAKQKLALRWTENGFVRDDKAAAGMDELSRRLRAEEVFLKLVKLFNEQRRPISPNRSMSHAPTLFSKHPDREGCSKVDFEHAMENLLSAGKIEVIQEGPPSRLVQRLKVVGEQLRDWLPGEEE